MVSWLLVVLGLISAHATTPVSLQRAEFSELDQGDRAWSEGRRGLAKQHWESAAESLDPAVQAMAEVRLVLVSGSLGMAVHGPASERALEVCLTQEDEDPWCSLAAADMILVQHHVGLPTDIVQAIDLAEAVRDTLPGPSEARLVWAGALALEEMAPSEGLGELMASHGGWPDGPGTWTLNLGPVAAPGMGAGGVIRLVHPDLLWRGWMLTTSAMVTNRDFMRLELGFRARTRLPFGFSSALSQHQVYLYETLGCVDTLRLRSLQARPWIGGQVGPVKVHGGPLFQSDRNVESGAKDSGHGAHLTLASQVERARATLSLQSHTETSLSSYLFVSTALDAQLHMDRLAFRLRSDLSAGDDAPLWRSPAYGGGFILRSAALGRWRSPLMAASIIEWRQPLTQILGLSFFAETAWADQFHTGAGLGIRLKLPPQPHNTMRLDVAYGEGAWTLSAGWGEAF